MNTNNEQKALRICNNKGFQMTFSNGLTVSVQFGWGNYCEARYNKSFGGLDSQGNYINDPAESNNAEIAVLDSKGNFVTKEFGYPDDVESYQTAEQIALLIFRVANKEVCL